MHEPSFIWMYNNAMLFTSLDLLCDHHVPCPWNTFMSSKCMYFELRSVRLLHTRMEEHATWKMSSIYNHQEKCIIRNVYFHVTYYIPSYVYNTNLSLMEAQLIYINYSLQLIQKKNRKNTAFFLYLYMMIIHCLLLIPCRHILLHLDLYISIS